MTIDTTKATNYSWMSQASYLDLSTVVAGDIPGFVARLKSSSINAEKVFADKQATIFTDTSTGYSFISQLPNTGNGTSATVFKSNKDGSYTIAVRGTEPNFLDPSDVLEDIIGVVAAGKAKVQLFEAFRYYKQITTEAGKDVVYSESEISMLSAVLLSGTLLTGALATLTAAKNAFVMLTANDKGLGKLIPDGATINFTGHSLGGHVAYLLAELVNSGSGGSHPLGDVMTYNAPGENALRYELQNWLGIDTSSQSGAIGSKHLALYGDGGLNVTAGLGQVIGTRAPLFIEKEGAISLANHSIVKLSDSLAVYTLLQKLDPNLTPSAIDTLLKAITATPTDSLEQALDAVRKITLGASVTPTKAAGSPDIQATRDAFYANLYGLQGENAFKALAGTAKIAPLSTSSPDTLVTQSQTGPNALAYRYALKELSPFVLLGADYGKHNQNGELTLAKDGGEITDQYLTDRAAFLSGVIDANLADTGSGKNLRADTGDTSIYFADLASGLTLQLTNSGSGQGTDGPLYRFGGTGNDMLFGGANADHLHGGAGMDRLEGGKDNDYLSGGQGTDTYQFTSGDGWDWIEDSDGAGAIYYKVGTDNIQITGGQAVGDSGMVWQQILNKDTANEKIFTYILTDWTENGQTFKRLSIEGPDGGMWIKNWKEGQLGITLPGVPKIEPPDFPVWTGSTTPSTGGWSNTAHLIVTGPESGYTTFAQGDFGQVISGGYLVGNDSGNYLIGKQFDDTLSGGAGRDALRGMEGDDRLDGGLDGDLLAGDKGDDYLVGDKGDDYLMGGRDRDTLIGGEGGDFLSGDQAFAWANSDWSWRRSDENYYDTANFSFDSTDGTMVLIPGSTEWYRAELAKVGEDDVLLGGIGNDYLHGGAGDDTLDGGDDNDRVYGGYGSDLLYGQNGNDTLHGNSGEDVLDGGEGNDTLWGDDGYTPVEDNGNDVVRGAGGNDEVVGSGGDDTLYGDSGIDIVIGDDTLISGEYHGRDQLFGGTEDDTLAGGGKNDSLWGGAGNDCMLGDFSPDILDGQYHGNDFLDGGEGADSMSGGGGNDILIGGGGNDALFGDAFNGGPSLAANYQGSDYLTGGDGADTLVADGGNDTLDGGTGADYLSGGEGDDLYLIGSGDSSLEGGGIDTISDSQGSNRLKLDMAASSLRLGRDNGALRIYWDNDTQGLYVHGGLSGSIKQFSLTDKELSWTQLINKYLQEKTGQLSEAANSTMVGGALDDALMATGGGSNFYGGLGADKFIGIGGNNTYVYELGDGHDVILDAKFVAGDQGFVSSLNTIRFGEGIRPEDISLALTSNAVRATMPNLMTGSSMSTAQLPYALSGQQNFFRGSTGRRTLSINQSQTGLGRRPTNQAKT